MKKVFLLLSLLLLTLSACEAKATIVFNIEDNYEINMYVGESEINLNDITAISEDGMNYSPFLDVVGEYDLNTVGTYNLSLEVTENSGAKSSIDIILNVLEPTCEMDNTQEKCIIRVTGIDYKPGMILLSTIYVDDFIKLEWIIEPIDATNQEITIESSDDEIASVSEYGYVFGHKEGSVTVTVKTVDGNYETSITITVITKSCLVDPYQEKCSGDILSDDSRVISLPDENVSGTDYSTVYFNNKIYYEIFVRRFANSDNDYIGDFQGIIDNLPYLKSLGIGGLWLMPIMVSESDHGYDTDDYYNVNPDYGTMDDFKELVSTAEAMGIDIIIDLVINHMGARNDIFQDVLRKGTLSDYYDWFTWITEDDPRYGNSGEWGQQIWYNPASRTWLTDYAFTPHSSLNDKYYCGTFSDWMPDLNITNPEVVDYINEVGKWWLTETGIAGFRMDAVSHLYGQSEFLGINDRRQANIAFLTAFHDELESVDPDVFVVVEAWESYQSYTQFVASDVSSFNFQAGYWIRDAVNGSLDNFGTTMNYVYTEYKKYDPNYIDTPFLTNHDQTRIAKELSNPLKTRLAGEILLTLPGSPFLYYGEEIGMLGERTNMPWGDYYDGLSVNFVDKDIDTVTEQLADPDSQLNSYIDIANARNNSLALSYGDYLPYTNSSLDGYYRIFENGVDKELVIVLINNSTITTKPIPSEFTSYEILYSSYDNNFGGIAPKGIIVLKLPFTLKDTLIN